MQSSVLGYVSIAAPCRIRAKQSSVPTSSLGSMASPTSVNGSITPRPPGFALQKGVYSPTRAKKLRWRETGLVPPICCRPRGPSVYNCDSLTLSQQNSMYQYIAALATRINHSGLTPRTQTLFDQAMLKGKFRWGRKAKLVAGASLHVALREAHKSGTLQDIAVSAYSISDYVREG